MKLYEMPVLCFNMVLLSSLNLFVIWTTLHIMQQFSNMSKHLNVFRNSGVMVQIESCQQKMMMMMYVGVKTGKLKNFKKH